MCGLSGGLSTTLVGQELRAIQVLSLVSNLRGMHSTGVIIGKRPKTKKKKKLPTQFVWTKTLGPSTNLVFSDRVLKHTVNDQNPFLFAVHTRHATLGSITEENAHPFQCQHIVGMHNGTAPSFKAPKNSTMTDSECIFWSIAEFGIDATIKRMDHNDAYALVWVDRNTNKINFIRNSKRTLFFAVNKTEDLLLWSSEKEMLEFAISRELSQAFTIEALEPNKLMSVNLNNIKEVDCVHLSPWPKSYGSHSKPTTQVITPAKTEKAIEKFPALARPPLAVKQTKKEPLKTKGEGTGSLIRYYPYEEVNARGDKVAMHNVMVEPYDGYMVPLTKFTDNVEKGCSLCTFQPKVDDVCNRTTKIHWYSKEDYVCSSCVKDGATAIVSKVEPQPSDRPDFMKERMN